MINDCIVHKVQERILRSCYTLACDINRKRPLSGSLENSKSDQANSSFPTGFLWCTCEANILWTASNYLFLSIIIIVLPFLTLEGFRNCWTYVFLIIYTMDNGIYWKFDIFSLSFFCHFLIHLPYLYSYLLSFKFSMEILYIFV